MYTGKKLKYKAIYAGVFQLYWRLTNLSRYQNNWNKE